MAAMTPRTAHGRALLVDWQPYEPNANAFESNKTTMARDVLAIEAAAAAAGAYTGSAGSNACVQRQG